MKWLLILAFCAANALCAQDADAFARALDRKSPRALDRWIKRELYDHRKGTQITSPGSSYTSHSATYDTLVAWLRQRPGVLDAEWDRCIGKLDLWPGHSTIGVQVRLGGVVRERCYTLQEGRPGTIKLPGWRPKVRKTREELKLVGVRECAGFAVEQRGYCAVLSR